MKLALIVSFMLGLPSLASATPFLCFTSEPKSASAVELENSEFPIELASMPTCHQMHGLSVGLNATALLMASGGIYAACTGVGAPATVYLEGGAMGVQALSLIVGLLPCDNSADENAIKAMARDVVCEELEKMGIACQL